jgi:hypothetical protein
MTEYAAFPTQRAPASAQRIRLISGYRNMHAALVKNQRGGTPCQRLGGIFQSVRLRRNAFKIITIPEPIPNWPVLS